MGIKFEDLSQAAQRQAVMQLARQTPNAAPRPASASASKYHNRPDDRAGVRFDSKKEALRYDELALLQTSGKIRALKLQPQFTLQEAYTTPSGERVRAIRYQADFSYERATEPDRFGEVHWVPVVEDVKSRATMTRVYSVKKKLMLEKYGVEIREIL